MTHPVCARNWRHLLGIYCVVDTHIYISKKEFHIFPLSPIQFLTVAKTIPNLTTTTTTTITTQFRFSARRSYFQSGNSEGNTVIRQQVCVERFATNLVFFFPELFSDLPIIRKVHNKTKEQRGERIIFRGWLLYPLLHSITGWSKSLTLKWLTTKNVFLVSNGNRPPQLHSTTQWIDFYWEKLFRSLRPKALLSLLNNSPCALKWYCKNWKLFSPFRCAFDGVIFLRLK